jgi:hypothetical protein
MAGAQAHHHAIIYSDRQVEYKGENLTKRAIRVEMTTSKEKLDEASRINYAKAYTIEYNVKVLFIGRVHHKHRHQLLADYQNSMGLYSDPPGPGPSYQQESPPNLVDTIEQISKSPISPGLSAAESVEFPYEASVSLVPPSKLDSAVVIKRPGLSRRSSVDTIESLFSNALSVSSTSTVGALKGGAQRLAEFLSAQDSLQTLLKEALQKVSLDDLEDNLRRSLIQFSAHLKAEATLPVMVEAASAVRRLARNAASLFRQSLEHEAKVTGDEGAAASDFTEHESQDQDDGDDDDDDLLEEKEGEDPMDLEVLLSKSVALRLLEENLRLFIYPNPVKRALFKIWPIAHPRNLSLTIKHDLEWEVPTFLEKYFPKGQQLGKVLTITGHAFNAQAQSCANYLLQTWPDISLILLAGLHELLSPGADG